jgi:hypothetical protein
MPVTKASIIYQALLAVNGGVVTPNMSTRYGEAEEYFAYAFNYAQLGTYWAENKAEMEHTINPLVLTPFDNVAVLYSSIRQRYYSTLPAPVVALPKGRSLEISDQNGKRLIPLTQGDDAMQEYYHDYDSQLKYQLEGSSTVWFYGMDKRPLLKYIRPKYIASVYDLPDTAEILLSADGYNTVTGLMVAFLKGERAMPKQYAETGKDISQ